LDELSRNKHRHEKKLKRYSAEWLRKESSTVKNFNVEIYTDAAS
jgi:hypothetical protein